MTTSREVDQDSANPPDLITQKETVSVKSRPLERLYDAATRTYTDTTPEGRQIVTTLDAKGRVARTQQTHRR